MPAEWQDKFAARQAILQHPKGTTGNSGGPKQERRKADGTQRVDEKGRVAALGGSSPVRWCGCSQRTTQSENAPKVNCDSEGDPPHHAPTCHHILSLGMLLLPLLHALSLERHETAKSGRPWLSTEVDFNLLVVLVWLPFHITKRQQ